MGKVCCLKGPAHLIITQPLYYIYSCILAFCIILLFACLEASSIKVLSHRDIRLLYFRDLGIFSYIAFLILSSQVISFSSFALYLVYGAWRRDVGGGHAPQRTYHSGSHHVNAIQAVERRCTFGPLASKSYSEGPETADLQLKIITF